jgi:GAF domain-containing protein
MDRSPRPAPAPTTFRFVPDTREPAPDDRARSYSEVIARIGLLLERETDWVAAMATVVCELHRWFPHYDWTGFYRVVGDELVIGPYQGGHGCLRIARGRGVCGAAWSEARTQLVPDVREFPGHIACSDSTLSEIVVPVKKADGSVIAVLDVDSDQLAAFTGADRDALESLCDELGERFG